MLKTFKNVLKNFLNVLRQEFQWPFKKCLNLSENV